MKYRRMVVSRHGGPDVLAVVEENLPEPRPGPGEVRIKVLAAGVSAYDLMHRRSGLLPGVPRVSFTLGEDVVGVIDKLGETVSALELGQRVAGGTFSLGGGGYAEAVCRPADDVVPVPTGVDSAEAVCLVVNYLTADLALKTAAVQAGERVLVHGAAGGVGTALFELGRLAGLKMYGTVSRHNHALVSALEATPIDYRSEDFVTRIHDLTGVGVDAVFDPIGGARQLWRSSRALNRGGRLVWFGVAATSNEGMRVIPFTLVALTMLKIVPNGKRAMTTPDLGKAAQTKTLAELLDHLANDRIKPVVAERVPLLEAARAHELLERGGHAGTLVLVTDAAS